MNGGFMEKLLSDGFTEMADIESVTVQTPYFSLIGETVMPTLFSPKNVITSNYGDE